jgi:hypothetical protein
MSKIAWIADKLSRRRLEREMELRLDALAQAPVRSSERSLHELLAALASEPGPKAHLGETARGEPVDIPLADLVRSCGLVHGGTGAGKSMAACAILEAVIERLPDSRAGRAKRS